MLNKEFKLHVIEVRGQHIRADEYILEVLGARYPSEIYTRQSLRTLKTHFKNFLIIDYDLRSITIGLEFEPASLVSMINWQVGTFIERRGDNILTLRFNSISNLRDAYYVIEETFSKLEEYLLVTLVKGNFFFFGNPIIKQERNKLSFLRNPLYEVISYIKFRQKESGTVLTSPLIRAMDTMVAERIIKQQQKILEKNIFHGILLMKILANRAIIGHHISAEMMITFRNVRQERLEKVKALFKSYKEKFEGISEENGYYIYSDIINDIKSVIYPKKEINRLIEETKEIIGILRDKTGRGNLKEI